MFLILFHECAYKLQDLRRLCIYGSWDLSLPLESPKAHASKNTIPRPQESAFLWLTSTQILKSLTAKRAQCLHKQRQASNQPPKPGKQPASKANKKCAAAEEVPLDIVTPKKKNRKSKKSKTEATEKILDVIEFNEAQKTTVTDETCKDLKLIVQMT